MHSLFVAIAISLACSTAFAQSQPPSPSPGKHRQPQQQEAKTTEQPTATDERGTEQLPVVIKLLPTPKTEDEAERERKDREAKAALDRELVTASDRLVVVTAVLAVIGILQLVVFGIQAGRLRQTVETMKDTAERQLRAYVSVEATSVRNWGGLTEFTFEIKNTGQTPAYDVTSFSNIHVLPYPLPKDAKKPVVTDWEAGTSKMVIGQNGKMTSYTSLHEVPTPAQLAGILNGGTERLYVVGVVTYMDIFKKQERHTWFAACVGGAKLAESFRNVAPNGQLMTVPHLFEYPHQLNEAD